VRTLACLEKIYGVLRRAASCSGSPLSPGRSPGLVSCVRSHVCVGPRHYCRNRNPTPSSLGTRLSLSAWAELHFFFYLPSAPPPSSLPASLISSRLTTRLAGRRCLLSTAPFPSASRAPVITHQRPPTFRPPAGRHRASMDLVSQSEHLCYVRCTYCNTVLAVNSSRNRIRVKHLWGRSWHSTRMVARYAISEFAL
jgi:hypothetical protein